MLVLIFLALLVCLLAWEGVTNRIECGKFDLDDVYWVAPILFIAGIVGYLFVGMLG